MQRPFEGSGISVLNLFYGKDKNYFLMSLLGHLLVVASLFAVGKNSSDIWGAHRQGEPTLVEFAVNSFHKLPTVVPKSKASFEGSLQKPTALSEPESSLAKTDAATAGAAVSESNQAALGHAQGATRSAPLGESDGVAASDRERYLYELRTLIERKKTYPQASRRLRETGRVVVKFMILKDGRIEAVDIKSGSSFARLNDAAMVLVRGIEKYKPFPQTVLNDQLSLEIPIEYVLN